MGSLKNKVSIITGSGRGIGKACAKELAIRGSSVVIADINQELAEATAHEIEMLGCEATAIKVDVSKSSEIDLMIKKILKKYNKIDILVNNAGLLGRKPLDQMDEEEWDRLFAINTKGQFLCCKAVIPHMKNNLKETNCKIINTSSVAAIIPRQNQAHYCSSKAAIIQMSRVLALELAAYKINVNVFCPGMTDTKMIGSTLRADSKAMERWKKSIPLGRIAKVEDHANMVLFLASPESDHITGQIFIVDGGQTINYSHGFGKNIFTLNVD